MPRVARRHWPSTRRQPSKSRPARRPRPGAPPSRQPVPTFPAGLAWTPARARRRSRRQLPEPLRLSQVGGPHLPKTDLAGATHLPHHETLSLQRPQGNSRQARHRHLQAHRPQGKAEAAGDHVLVARPAEHAEHVEEGACAPRRTQRARPGRRASDARHWRRLACGALVNLRRGTSGTLGRAIAPPASFPYVEPCAHPPAFLC